MDEKGKDILAFTTTEAVEEAAILKIEIERLELEQIAIRAKCVKVRVENARMRKALEEYAALAPPYHGTPYLAMRVLSTLSKVP